jgi:hypothetical protein
MNVHRIYCESGAWRKKLAALEREGAIELVAFPYEGRSRRTPTLSIPSKVTADMTHLTCDSDLPISFCDESSMFGRIRSIVGAENEFDIRHIDAAYKSRCAAFLTPDKHDILRHRFELEELLRIRFFHAIEDWEVFLKFLRSRDA